MGSVSSSAENPEYHEVENTNKNGEEPKPGDLIEIFRVGYKHWAVYIGKGYVVHLVVNGLGSSSSGTVPVPGDKGVVKKEKLKDVVLLDKWTINNYLDEKYTPQQIYAIVKQATGFVDSKLPYNLLTYNCEHFATDLRYGKPTSRQVRNAAAGVGLGVFATLAAGVITIVGLVLGPSRN